MRYQSLTDPSALEAEKELHIRITPDEENNTLSIFDTGIGMTKADTVNNLGIIAKSGIKVRHRVFLLFLFGRCSLTLNRVGLHGGAQLWRRCLYVRLVRCRFHSAYLVAVRVQVISKHNDEEQYI